MRCADERLILHITRAIGHSLTALKKLHMNACLIKAYPFQSITHPSTSFILDKMILDNILCKYFSEYRLILAEKLGYTTLFHCLQYVFYTLSAVLQYGTPDAFLVLYGEYSTHFPFAPPTQSSLYIYKEGL